MPPGPPAPPTIYAHKAAFLNAQVLLLSQPLAPSHAWREANDNPSRPHDPADDDAAAAAAAASVLPLADKAVDDALYRLNQQLAQHARRVYAPQASRHVAEQIEALILDAGHRAFAADEAANGVGDDAGDEGDENAAALDGDGVLRQGDDLAHDNAIAQLPAEASGLPGPHDAETHPAEAQRYADLRARLDALADRRRAGRARLARLRRLRDLAAPFRPGRNGTGPDAADADATAAAVVQSNLITRDGAVEKELERMRMLLVRVAGRVDQLGPPPPPPTGGRKRGAPGQEGEGEGEVEVEDPDDLDAEERRKVARLLEGF